MVINSRLVTVDCKREISQTANVYRNITHVQVRNKNQIQLFRFVP